MFDLMIKIIKIILILAMVIVILICVLFGFITAIYIPEMPAKERPGTIITLVMYAAISIGLLVSAAKLWRWRK